MRGTAVLRYRKGVSPGLRVVLLLAALTLFAAACGGGAESETDAGGGGGDGGAAAGETPADGELASCMDSDEPVELLVWGSRDYYLPPDRFEGLMEQYPNLTINWDVQANDDILQQLQRMNAAGQPMPDIVHDDTFRVPDYMAGGLLRPIDDLMAQWEEEEPEQYEQILPITWEENQIDDQTWGMSIMANFDIVYFSKPWFEEAGVSPSFETFQDLYDTMTAMKETRPDSIPLTIQALAGEGVTVLITTASAAGVPFEGFVPDFGTPQGQYLLQFYMDAAANDLLPPEAISWGEAETRGAFIRGDAGLIFDGITVAGDFAQVGDFNYDEDWLTTLLPTDTGEGEPGNWVTQARTWMLTSDTEHPCEAGLVMRYLADEQVLLDTLANGAVPPRHEGALEGVQEILPLFTDELQEGFLQAGTFPSGPQSGEVENVLEQLWGEIVTGQATDPAALWETYEPQLAEFRP